MISKCQLCGVKESHLKWFDLRQGRRIERLRGAKVDNSYIIKACISCRERCIRLRKSFKYIIVVDYWRTIKYLERRNKKLQIQQKHFGDIN